MSKLTFLLILIIACVIAASISPVEGKIGKKRTTRNQQQQQQQQQQSKKKINIPTNQQQQKHHPYGNLGSKNSMIKELSMFKQCKNACGLDQLCVNKCQQHISNPNIRNRMKNIDQIYSKTT